VFIRNPIPRNHYYACLVGLGFDLVGAFLSLLCTFMNDLLGGLFHGVSGLFAGFSLWHGRCPWPRLWLRSQHLSYLHRHFAGA
jgi:hypothetical protein